MDFVRRGHHHDEGETVCRRHLDCAARSERFPHNNPMRRSVRTNRRACSTRPLQRTAEPKRYAPSKTSLSKRKARFTRAIKARLPNDQDSFLISVTKVTNQPAGCMVFYEISLHLKRRSVFGGLRENDARVVSRLAKHRHVGGGDSTTRISDQKIILPSF